MRGEATDMNLSDVYSVTVFLQAVGATVRNFGIPMILGISQRWADVVRTYTTQADMTNDGFLADDPEYIAAGILLSQQPKVPEFRVGRRALLPELAYTVTPTYTAGATYELVLDGQLISVVAATNLANLCDQIADAIDALAPAAWVAATPYTVGQIVTNDTGKKYECIVAGTSAGSGGPTGYGGAIVDNTVTWAYIGVQPTAVDNGTTIVVTVPAGAGASEYFSLAISDAPGTQGLNGLAIESTHTDPGIATDLAAIFSADNSWYAFQSVTSGTAEVKAAAAWAASVSELFVQASVQSTIATVVLASATDVATYLKGVASSHTAIMFHETPDEFIDAGWMGTRLTTLPGTENWMFQTVVGATPDRLTETQIGNINSKNANWYTQLGASGNTGKGICSGGQYLDTIRFVDASSNAAQVNGFNCLKANALVGKTPLDARGGGILAANLRQTYKVYEKQHPPGLDTDTAIVPGTTVVTQPDYTAIPSSDKAERVLNGLQVAFTYSGAVDKVNVSVAVSL